MEDNRNAGYGRGKLDALAPANVLGKVFVVGATTVANYQAAQRLIMPDKNGKLRLYTTIALAMAQCTANAEDIIYVLPGHTETVSSATTYAWNVAGVKIIGLGRGSLRPTLTVDTGATSTINISAANIGLKNCIIVANFADIASAITTTTAQELTLEDVEFRDTDSTHNFLRIIDTDATSNHTDGLTLTRVRRIGAGATTATTIIKMDGTNDRLTVKGCYFAHLNVDDGGLFMIIATGKIVTNVDIEYNIFNFLDVSSATAGILITTNGSTNSGVIANNYIKHLDTTTEILVTASSGFIFFQNFATAVADKSGYILPPVDS